MYCWAYNEKEKKLIKLMRMSYREQIEMILKNSQKL